jgi:hypothetical protein
VDCRRDGGGDVSSKKWSFSGPGGDSSETACLLDADIDRGRSKSASEASEGCKSRGLAVVISGARYEGGA